MRGRGSPMRGARGGGRGGRGGARFAAPSGPPDSIVEVGEIVHSSEQDVVCKCTLSEKVPYFNGRLFLSNKQEIGKVDEIFGPIHRFMFSVKLGDSLKAASFKPDTKLFIDAQQILPLSRFVPRPGGSEPKPAKGIGRGGARGGRGGGLSRGGPSRGGRGGGFSRGGNGFSRGGRGGFRGGR